MAKIDRVEDLPEWFDLEKYQGCKVFGADEWLEQVGRRYDLLKLRPGGFKSTLPKYSDTLKVFTPDALGLLVWLSEMSASAPQVRAAPLDSPSKGKIREWMTDPSNQPVKALCPLDILWQSVRDKDAEDDGKALAGMSKRWDTSINSPQEFRSHATSPLYIDYYNGAPEIPVVQINLGASDAVLKASFAAWLKEARAHQKTGTVKRSKSLYDRWARYGLLPYLDLLTWSMETETHIPDRVMSAAISSYDAGEANLRKTVAPLAEALMGDFSELRALAAIEAAKAPVEPETFEG